MNTSHVAHKWACGYVCVYVCAYACVYVCMCMKMSLKIATIVSDDNLVYLSQGCPNKPNFSAGA